MNASILRKAAKLYEQGYSYRALADEIEQSTGQKYAYEYYRIKLLEIGVGKSRAARLAEFKRERDVLRKEEEREEREAFRARGLKCEVCRKTIMRNTRNPNNKTRTCSHECAENWVKLRYYLSDDVRSQTKISLAKWSLKNPSKVNPSTLKHSRRVLKGNAGTHGRWLIKGSKTSKLLKKHRPDLAKKIESGNA